MRSPRSPAPTSATTVVEIRFIPRSCHRRRATGQLHLLLRADGCRSRTPSPRRTPARSRSGPGIVPGCVIRRHAVGRDLR
jgi:hypothetical protein